MERSSSPNNKWIGGSTRYSVEANFKWILCQNFGPDSYERVDEDGVPSKKQCYKF